MDRFGLDDVQAQAIVQMPLGSLTGLERQKLEEELAAIEAKIADLKDILANRGRLMGIIKDEALEVKRKFGDERRTEIAAISGEVDIEDLIPREECVLTLTNFGYVKRQPADTYPHPAPRRTRRLGHEHAGMRTWPPRCSSSARHDYVMFFTNLGRVYRLKCYEIPGGLPHQQGHEHCQPASPLLPDERVTSMIRVPEFDEEQLPGYGHP